MGRSGDRAGRRGIGAFARRTLGGALAGALVALSMPAAALAEPIDPSPTADKVSGFYDAIFWAVVAVFAVAEGLIIAAALRPRPPPADDPSPSLARVAGSGAEIAWTVAPAVFLALVAVLAYRAFH